MDQQEVILSQAANKIKHIIIEQIYPLIEKQRFDQAYALTRTLSENSFINAIKDAYFTSYRITNPKAFGTTSRLGDSWLPHGIHFPEGVSFRDLPKDFKEVGRILLKTLLFLAKKVRFSKSNISDPLNIADTKPVIFNIVQHENLITFFHNFGIY